MNTLALMKNHAFFVDASGTAGGLAIKYEIMMIVFSQDKFIYYFNFFFLCKKIIWGKNELLKSTWNFILLVSLKKYTDVLQKLLQDTGAKNMIFVKKEGRTGLF